MTNPYKSMPNRAFWRQSVAELHVADFADLWTPIELKGDEKVATAGSCFAQHIGRNLKKRGVAYMDMEPAPDFLVDENEARRFGYGVFSCRYGNIYTSRQLLQLVQEVFCGRTPSEIVWEKQGRFFDALRPGLTPVGEAAPEDVIESRKAHLQAVKQMFETLDLFVFTMGLTEGWESSQDGTIFPTAPGTIAGSFSSDRYVFHNLRYGEVLKDMQEFWRILKSVNPSAKMLLTISPVPLIATASSNHVLCATTYSKSVLRSVAGDLAADYPDIFYFPSYEIVSGHPSRGAAFNPDLRTVNDYGVELVMRHFFANWKSVNAASPQEDASAEFDVICDEEAMLK